jgi:chromosome segregation ATPase
MKSIYLTALTHPLNTATLALAAAAGLCAAWWLFPIGMVLWLIMVINIARDPAAKTQQAMDSRAPLASNLQPLFDRVERVQIKILHAVEDADDAMKKVLQPIQAEADALTDRAYKLCRRMTSLENYRLVSQTSSNARADLDLINEKINRATDPIVKRELEETRKSMETRAQKMEDVSNQILRVEAQLLSLANAMDTSLTEIMRLQAADPAEAAAAVPDIVQTLKGQMEQLRKFEKEISKRQQ